LFADTLGDAAAVVLTDENAVRAAIVEQFEKRLAATGEDGFVVVTFSGHGSDDYFLVTHDADPDDLGATSIHLDELVDREARFVVENELRPLRYIHLAPSALREAIGLLDLGQPVGSDERTVTTTS
jgi:hypothetical protein